MKIITRLLHRKPKVSKISLESLSRIWLDSPSVYIQPGREVKPEGTKVTGKLAQNYKAQDITSFYNAYVEPYAKTIGERGLKAVEKILHILDSDGDCPSVVTTSSLTDEVANTYQLLAKVSLRDHSLNVAREAMNLIRESYPDHQMIAGKTLMASLGHDLGKIPSNSNKRYYTGQHPIKGANVVSRIVKDIPYGNEVLKAIRNHHFEKIEDQPLTSIIKEADHRAREGELQKIEGEKAPDIKSPGIKSSSPNSPDQSSATPAKISPSASPERELWRAGPSALPKREQSRPGLPAGPRPAANPAEPVVKPTKSKAGKPSKLDLPWISPDEVLEILKPYVNAYVDKQDNNRIIESDIGYWMAFSFKNGLVYVMPKLFNWVAKRIATNKGQSGFILRCKENDFLRNVEFTVVEKMRTKGYIADTIGRDYVGAKYLVYLNGGNKPLNGFYTPFKAEAFGNLSKLEKAKKGSLRRIEPEKDLPKDSLRGPELTKV